MLLFYPSTSSIKCNVIITYQKTKEYNFYNYMKTISGEERIHGLKRN